MNILTDLHCHTLASVHAYSTVKEIAELAKEKGLEAVAITDHGMALEQDAPMEWHFSCFRREVPGTINGVRILAGCEANILDKSGRIEFPEWILKKLDIVIASIHKFCYYIPAGGEHTSSYLGALNNQYVDILGHTGNPDYCFDIDKVVKTAKELNKLIEINAHSFDVRTRNVELCCEIAKACKKYGTGIVVNSDAHICYNVGNVQKAIAMLEDIDFPEELVINRNLEELRNFLAIRKKI